MCVNSVNTEYRLVYPRPGLAHRRNQARSSSCPLAEVGWLPAGRGWLATAAKPQALRLATEEGGGGGDTRRRRRKCLRLRVSARGHKTDAWQVRRASPKPQPVRLGPADT